MSSLRRNRSAERGLTFIELTMTMVVLGLGLMAMTQVVLQTTRSNRRTLAATQAQMIAERELERLALKGCANSNPTETTPCRELEAEQTSPGNPPHKVYWSSAGAMSDVDPGPTDPLRREYRVLIDVDPPFEGAEVGNPAVRRTIALDPNNVPTAGNVRNVRVTVTWKEPPSSATQVVVLQTRVSP